MKYDYIYSLEKDGCRMFELNGKDGLLYNNKEIIPAKYDFIGYLEEDGCRIFELNGKVERKNIKERLRKEKIRKILK